MVTFLFSVHTITEAKTGRAVDFPARSFDLARSGVAPLLFANRVASHRQNID